MKMKEAVAHRRTRIFAVLIALCLAGAAYAVVQTQRAQKKKSPTPGPMLEQGYVELQTPAFSLRLVKSSQTVASLKPKREENFDFTPGDLLVERSKNGYYHLGDIDLRLRTGNSGEWKNYSTALARRAVIALPTTDQILAAADLAPTMPGDIPVQVIRSWGLEDGKLILRFTLKNKSAQSVEIGALGIPMIFNNVLNERSLEHAHAVCSFYDPYIGEDAGYLQVTRLNGHGPVLLVLPYGNTPLEAYNPILDAHGAAEPSIFRDPTPRGITFEGFYDWMVHSAAYAENEWSQVTPWNPATKATLAPGESKTYGVEFVTADSIRNIEKTLAENARPVAVGVPGYILPMGMDARLFLKYREAVKSVSVEPAGAIEIKEGGNTKTGWKKFSVQGELWGRARLTVTYSDGLVQTVHYFVTKPEAQVLADMGHFLTTRQWYTDRKDPFHRAPSIMTYDREANAIVMQDSRAWIAGLGDEGGGGAWLATIMKQLGAPEQGELAKFQEFVDGTLWGGLQYKDGPKKYGVRKSLFYYQPDQFPADFYRKDFDWSSWTKLEQRTFGAGGSLV